MDLGAVVNAELSIPSSEFTWRFSRSSGPGGQSVNTTDSRVELVWDPHASLAVQELPEAVRDRLLARLKPRLVDGTLRIAASQYRSQHRNRQAALERLAATLRAELAPPRPHRRKTRISRGAKERRLQAKKSRSTVKAGRRPVNRDSDT